MAGRSASSSMQTTKQQAMILPLALAMTIGGVGSLHPRNALQGTYDISRVGAASPTLRPHPYMAGRTPLRDQVRCTRARGGVSWALRRSRPAFFTRMSAQASTEPGAHRGVAVVTGAGNGLGYQVAFQLLATGFFVVFAVHAEDASDSFLALEKRLALEGFQDQSLVVHMDVRRVKSISQAAQRMQPVCPNGISVLVNNAAVHPDGFEAQEILDVNFFGAQNVIRRMVPARWPEAMTGRWLPAKSGWAGMRRGGVIVNIVCQSSFTPEECGGSEPSEIQALRLGLQKKFEECQQTETAIVMKLTEYLGHVAAGTHISAGWPSNAYLVSKVKAASRTCRMPGGCAHHVSRAVALSKDALRLEFAGH
jgi:NAD(P)-dependent dehydrogenase (short-subunit alcohol dehydrogenase family)